jgi:hypothetical protein
MTDTSLKRIYSWQRSTRCKRSTMPANREVQIKTRMSYHGIYHNGGKGTPWSCWGWGETGSLVRLQNKTVAVENSLGISWGGKPYYSAIAFGHLFQRNDNLPSHRNLHTKAHNGFVHYSQKLIQLRCLSMGEWLNYSVSISGNTLNN